MGKVDGGIRSYTVGVNGKNAASVTAGVLALGFLGLVGMHFESSHQVTFICQHTLSAKGYRAWPMGIRTARWQRTSPLERHLRARGKTVTHDWKRVAYTGKDLYGRSISFMNFKDAFLVTVRQKVSSRWLEGRQQIEVDALVYLLQSGTRTQIEERVRAIADEGR